MEKEEIKIVEPEVTEEIRIDEPELIKTEEPVAKEEMLSTGGYSGIALVGVLSSITATILAMIGIGFVTFFK